MSTRSRRLIAFRNPFALGALKEIFPPGDDRAETKKELREVVPFPADYLDLETINSEEYKVMTIDPRELDDSVKNDHTNSDLPRPSMKTSRANAFDRKAINRAEDEGMSAPPTQVDGKPARLAKEIATKKNVNEDEGTRNVKPKARV